jgi:hypothetical protein
MIFHAECAEGLSEHLQATIGAMTASWPGWQRLQHATATMRRGWLESCPLSPQCACSAAIYSAAVALSHGLAAGRTVLERWQICRRWRFQWLGPDQDVLQDVLQDLHAVCCGDRTSSAAFFQSKVRCSCPAILHLTLHAICALCWPYAIRLVVMARVQTPQGLD